MIAELPPVAEEPELQEPEPEEPEEPPPKPRARRQPEPEEPEPPKPRTRRRPESEPEPEQEPQPKRRGRPPKPPGVPKAKYTPRKPKMQAREPVYKDPEVARHIGEVGDAQVEAMTRYMVTQLGTAKRGALETRRNGWRQMIAGHYI